MYTQLALVLAVKYWHFILACTSDSSLQNRVSCRFWELNVHQDMLFVFTPMNATAGDRFTRELQTLTENNLGDMDCWKQG